MIVSGVSRNVPVLSVARAVKEKVPAVVGLLEGRGFIGGPGGSPAMAREQGYTPPLTSRVSPKDRPAVPVSAGVPGAQCDDLQAETDRTDVLSKAITASLSGASAKGWRRCWPDTVTAPGCPAKILHHYVSRTGGRFGSTGTSQTILSAGRSRSSC